MAQNIHANSLRSHLGAGVRSWMVPAAAAVLAALLVWLGTRAYGPGLTPDSVTYIAAARHLGSGEGALNYDSLPLVYQPPLYPLALAAAGRLTGQDPRTVAAALNALLYALAILIVARMLGEELRSQTGAALGAAVVALSGSLLGIYLMAWSEPLFIVLTMVWLWQLAAYLRDGSSSALVVASCAAALACLTRYTGVALVGTTGLCALLAVRSFRERITHAVLAGVIGMLPLSLFAGRNYLLSGTFFGPRWPSSDSFVTNVSRAVLTIQGWIVPGGAGKLFGAVVAAAIVVRWARGHRPFAWLPREPGDAGRISALWLCSALLVTVYATLIVSSSTSVAVDPIGDRLLAPAMIPAMLVAIILVAHLLRGSALTPRRQWLFATLGIWILLSASNSARLIAGRHDGRGYAADVWRASPTIAFLTSDDRAADCALYSNNPAAVYILTNRPTRVVPVKIDYESMLNFTASTLDGRWPEEGRACVVWFTSAGWGELFSVEELGRVADIRSLAEFADGAVYVASPRISETRGAR